MFTDELVLPMWVVLFGFVSIITSLVLIVLRINVSFKANEFVFNLKWVMSVFYEHAPKGMSFLNWLNSQNHQDAHSPGRLLADMKFDLVEQRILDEFCKAKAGHERDNYWIG